MSKKDSIVIFGAGGHSKVVADAITAEEKYVIRAAIDPASRNTHLGGVAVQISETGLTPGNFIVAIGKNSLRKRLFVELCKAGWTPVVVRHPTAIVAPDVRIAGGSVLLARSVINPGSVIGENCIINTGAIVEHDCIISNHAHVAPGACMAGWVVIGEGCLIGIGSNIIQSVQIGGWSTLGAGSTAIKDVPENATAVGVPARVKKNRGENASVKV